MADKPGKKNPKKLSNVGTAKRKEILVWKTEQEIFEATKLAIETEHGAKGLEVDQTAKPNQTSLGCTVLKCRYRKPKGTCIPRAYQSERTSGKTPLENH